MTTPSKANPTSATGIGGYLRLATRYWRGSTARSAWFLTLSIALIMAATLGVSVTFSYWNRWFFDAIEKKDTAALLRTLLWLPGLILCGAGLAMLMVRTRMLLQVRWREYVTQRMLGLWFGNQRYYRIGLARRDLDNAEYRIADDVRLSTEPTVDLAVGLAWAVSSALAFVGVLFTVGGSIRLGGVTIPGYLAIAAVGYAALVCGLTFHVGRPLAGRISAKNEAEAELRYELTRVRDNAESIAFMHGDERERRQARSQLGAVVASWTEVIRHHGNLTWVLNSNSFLAPVVPAILAAPKYLAGEMTLGAVMQVIAAFGSVLGALNWVADNYIRLSEVYASATRVEALRAGLVGLDGVAPEAEGRAGVLTLGTAREQAIELTNVTLRKGDGSTLLEQASITVPKGERILIEGRSGSGKSTLLRSMAGLWPWAEGRIRLPEGAKVAFVPQRPYIPIGRLKDALSYPSAGELSNEEAVAILERVGLGHLTARIEERDAWDRVLSGGERQRLAFARLLVQRPDIIVLDEATSALDDSGQHDLFELLTTELPGATLLNVAHRQGLEKFHDRRLVIDRGSTSSSRIAVGQLARRAVSRLGTRARRGKEDAPAGDTPAREPREKIWRRVLARLERRRSRRRSAGLDRPG